MRRYILDIEASSLSADSYPIEIGWVDTASGEGESYLIKPEPGWQDWSIEAEGLHGISRQQLARKGVPCPTVAARILELMSDAEVYTDAPEWDGNWLRKLLLAAKVQTALHISDIAVLYGQACRPLLGLAAVSDMDLDVSGTRMPLYAPKPRSEIERIAREIVSRAEDEEERRTFGRVKHRALPDVEAMYRTLISINDAVARALISSK